MQILSYNTWKIRHLLISVELPIYYLYVDDILLAAPKDRLNILLLIKYHSRLQFTVELEEKHCINFLDLTIKIENTITLDWFHKASFSGRCLSFFSNPLCYKIGTIYIMMDRTVLLSHPSYHQKNLRLVVDTLFNGSSMDFRKIDNRLKYLITTKLNKIPVTSHGWREADHILSLYQKSFGNCSLSYN